MPDARPLVLIVDDQPVNLKVLAAALDHDYAIQMATNGADALTLARRSPSPDLILLDVRMPEMDGYAVCAALKADPLTADIPVIFLTAQAAPASESQALAHGAVDFVHKPFDLTAIVLRVKLHVQLRQREQALRESKQQLELALEAGALGLWDYDLATGALTWSERHAGLLGFAPNQRSATLRTVRDAIDTRDRRACLANLRRTVQQGVAFDQVYRIVWPDGTLHWLHSLGQVALDSRGVPRQLIGTSRDISDLKARQDELEQMARHDVLTGLPNRLLLCERLRDAMARARRGDYRLAVAYLDLDGFKAINDTHGHAVGDQLLRVVAHRMQRSLRAVDTLARMGGDEFAAVLVDLNDADDCVTVSTRLLATALAPVRLGALRLEITASLGVTFYPQAKEVDGDHLLRQADQAMYRAKQAGKHCCHLYTDPQADAAHA
jgi:diguanylate cyclase (GGDEF)-like protein